MNKKPNWKNAMSLWDKYCAPFRPSPEEIKSYTNILKGFNKKNIMLLGATPEIRKIATNLSIKIFIADYSYDMIMGMLNIGAKIDYSKEKWIISNWLSLDNFLKKNHFDLIIGDLVLRNINKNNQKKFINIISNLLKKDGCFAVRFHFINKYLKSKNGHDIIKELLKLKSQYKEQLIEDLITSRLFDKYTDKHNETNKIEFEINVKKYLKKQNNLDHKDKLILNNILEKWAGPRTWAQNTQKNIDKILIKYFKINDIITTNDYPDSRYYPIYILKKK